MKVWKAQWDLDCSEAGHQEKLYLQVISCMASIFFFFLQWQNKDTTKDHLFLENQNVGIENLPGGGGGGKIAPTSSLIES